MRRILVVEDDAKTREALELYLRREGYDVSSAADGETAVAAAEHTRPHLVLLDLMLPRVDGLEVARRLRSKGEVAIIMVTARSTEDDKLTGLDAGADDYVTKPFSPREVMARVRAVLRRCVEDDVIAAGPITIDRRAFAVTVNDEAVALTRTEFRLLDALVRGAGRTFTRDELLLRIAGDDTETLDRTVDAHIMKLRRKLGEEGKSIATVFGVGYKFSR